MAAVLWTQSTRWMPDGYFYRAQVLRILGAEKEDALRTVFQGRLTLAHRRAETGLSGYQRKMNNSEWVRESAQFYERRRIVPLLSAPLDGVARAERSSLRLAVGLRPTCAPALRAHARLWFPLRIAVRVVAAALLVEPLRTWSSSPLTDSWDSHS